jgi:uncharacterized membrane protein YfcA
MVSELEINLVTWLGLVIGSLVAGTINTLAGGGSLITVPLLVLAGLPATTANGTNRIGVLFQNLVSTLRFRKEGLDGIKGARPILGAILAGSILGATIASRMPAELFRQVFGVAMIALLVPILRGTKKIDPDEPMRVRSGWLNQLIFFGIGVYGGAIQAGVGIFLIAALSRSGLDLVRANVIKVVLVGLLTVVAVPIFVLHDQVEWRLASALVVGFALGGEVGARAALLGGERLIRPVLLLAVLALAGRMIGLY